jgi:hypothetical protein
MFQPRFQTSPRIHHLSLDAPSRKFYSVPIFDTLATLAIPVAIRKRTPSAPCSLRLLACHSQSPVSNKQLNPDPPDGGQLTT